MYSNNVHGDEQNIRRSNNKTDRKKDMIQIYDQARRIFIVPSVPDMNYVQTYDKADDNADKDESANEQQDTTESEESAEQRRNLLKRIY